MSKVKIKNYCCGEDCINENMEFLKENPYISMFFILDAKLLKEANNINYAFKVEEEDKKAIVMKVEPYNAMFYGDNSLVAEIIDYIKANNMELKHILCETSFGQAIANYCKEKYGITYEEDLAMDFMEAKTISDPSSDEVIPASKDDIDEIFDNITKFYKDCGLLAVPSKEKVESYVQDFRIIKEGDKVISMGRITLATDKSLKIADVYTKDEYRGRGLARKIVTTSKNEILSKGMIATLNVDRRNPITNYLYRSIGFERVFSQGEFRLK